MVLLYLTPSLSILFVDFEIINFREHHLDTQDRDLGNANHQSVST